MANTKFRVCGVISKGEVLFEIDRFDYVTSLDSYGRRVSQRKSIALLEKSCLKAQTLRKEMKIGALTLIKAVEKPLNALQKTLVYETSPFEQGGSVTADSPRLSFGGKPALKVLAPTGPGPAFTAFDFSKSDDSTHISLWFEGEG